MRLIASPNLDTPHLDALRDAILAHARKPDAIASGPEALIVALPADGVVIDVDIGLKRFFATRAFAKAISAITDERGAALFQLPQTRACA